MSSKDLLLLYILVGFACALAVMQRSSFRASTIVSATMTIFLWPIWAPFALASKSTFRIRTSETNGLFDRLEKALAEAALAAEGTPMVDIFSKKVAAEMTEQITRISARITELEAISKRSDFDREASARRLYELERTGASERALQTARLHLEGIDRLLELRKTDTRTLEELADLLEALRTQFILARYSGSSAEGASAIVADVFARLEGLGAALDPDFISRPSPMDL